MGTELCQRGLFIPVTNGRRAGDWLRSGRCVVPPCLCGLILPKTDDEEKEEDGLRDTYCTKTLGDSGVLVSKLGKVGKIGVADSASTTCHKNATRLGNWITAQPPIGPRHFLDSTDHRLHLHPTAEGVAG
ncbi:hypothetical protein ACOMHN_027842 [Nucella lapillus]